MVSPVPLRRGPGRADHRLVVAALGLSQIIGYGTLYYAFSVLAPSIAKDLDWSTEWIFGALSVALLAGGLAAPWAGRWSDRHGAGRVMALGSVAAALALAGAALAPNIAIFLLGLVAIEVASTFVQYTAAFALLVQIDHERAPRNITYLTLIGGFASTLLWPITTALHQVLTWREVYLLFASVHLLVCLPIHAWLSAVARSGAGDADPAGTAATAPASVGDRSTAKRSSLFLLMAAGFSLLSFVNAAILVHMLPVLGALGLGATGVLVGALFGPAQVASRLTNMVFGGRLSAPALAVVAALFEPLAVALLVISAPWVPGAVVFSVVFGLSSGLGSIVQGTLPLALFGRRGYGDLTGRIAAVRLIVSASAPFAFAFVMEKFGVLAALGVTGTIGVGAIAAFVRIARMTSTRRTHSRRMD